MDRGPRAAAGDQAEDEEEGKAAGGRARGEELSEDDFGRITEGFYKPTYELFKQLQDYLKVLITLNTASILIIIALLEKVFLSPKLKSLLLISFSCFIISLVASLFMMTSISKFYAFLVDLNTALLQFWTSKTTDLKVHEAKKNELQERVKDISAGKLNRYSLANYSYLCGVVVLVIFVAINFLCR